MSWTCARNKMYHILNLFLRLLLLWSSKFRRGRCASTPSKHIISDVVNSAPVTLDVATLCLNLPGKPPPEVFSYLLSATFGTAV